MNTDEIIKAYSETVRLQNEIIESLSDVIATQTNMICQLAGLQTHETINVPVSESED